MLVRPDDGAVDDEPFQVGILEGVEDPAPDSLLGPPVEPSPGAIPVAEALGEVTPGGTGLADPQYSVDEKSVILGGHTNMSVLAGQQVLDVSPAFVRDLVTPRLIELS